MGNCSIRNLKEKLKASLFVTILKIVSYKPFNYIGMKREITEMILSSERLGNLNSPVIGGGIPEDRSNL
nr:MAG: hypothetical protein [Bacteriophage sp.]